MQNISCDCLKKYNHYCNDCKMLIVKAQEAKKNWNNDTTENLKLQLIEQFKELDAQNSE
jgi:hypothetical protein